MERIYKARNECGMSQSELSRKCGVTPSAISHLEKGNTKSLSGDLLVRMSRALNVSAEWLANGTGPMSERNTAPGPALRGTVPLISTVQAGNFAEAIDNMPPGEGERINVTVPVNAHTFALRVMGDSMEPEFQEGMIIIVEPDLDPRPGDYVIAKNGEDATFKKLIKDGSDYYLKPLNKDYKTKPLGDGRIIGVVRETIRRYR